MRWKAIGFVLSLLLSVERWDDLKIVPIAIPEPEQSECELLWPQEWKLLYLGISDELIEGIRQWRKQNPDHPIHP